MSGNKARYRDIRLVQNSGRYWAAFTNDNPGGTAAFFAGFYPTPQQAVDELFNQIAKAESGR